MLVQRDLADADAPLLDDKEVSKRETADDRASALLRLLIAILEFVSPPKTTQAPIPQNTQQGWGNWNNWNNWGGVTTSSTTPSADGDEPCETDSSPVSLTSSSTTTRSTSSTTSGADMCPATLGAISNGYSIYCGYAIDESTSDTNILQQSAATFSGCMSMCNGISSCDAISFSEIWGICTLYQAPHYRYYVRSGYRAAIKTTSITSSGASTGSGQSVGRSH